MLARAALLAWLAGLLLSRLLLSATLLLARLTRLWIVLLLLLVRVLVLLVHFLLLGVFPPTAHNVPQQQFVPVAATQPNGGSIAAKARRGNWNFEKR